MLRSGLGLGLVAAVLLRRRLFQESSICVLGALEGLHSLVDYPERSLSLAVVTGMLGGLLGRIVGGRGGSGVSREVAG